jgi:thioredoxin reductase (NADPH)
MVYDVVIIGGGPAGLTAGIYAARAGLLCAIVEKRGIGGQASLTSEIENYPGVETISGFDLTMKMHAQAERFGVEFIYEDIVKLELDKKIKAVYLVESTIESRSVILCMGASHKKLGLPREAELTGRGVSYCATCDGAFFRGKTVTVAGGGNTAVMDALYLERFAKQVYLVHRRDELRAAAILANRVKASSVNIVWDSVITQINGDAKLSSVTLKNVKTGAVTELKTDGLFVAIGQNPETALADGVQKDEAGYIIAKEDMSTNLSGVFVAGDLRLKPLRQIVTACADGAIAADSASKWLAEN